MSADNVSDLREQWDHDAIYVREDDPLYDLLQTIAAELNRLDDDIDLLLDDRFVDTATEQELDRLGKLVGVERPYQEDDDAFRIRVKAAYAKATSTCDYDTFAEIAVTILDADASQVELTFSFDTESATVTVVAPDTVIEGNPLTQSELKEFLQDAVQAAHEVNLQAEGSFQFLESDGTAPDGTGFNEGTWTESV